MCHSVNLRRCQRTGASNWSRDTRVEQKAHYCENVTFVAIHSLFEGTPREGFLLKPHCSASIEGLGCFERLARCGTDERGWEDEWMIVDRLFLLLNPRSPLPSGWEVLMARPDFAVVIETPVVALEPAWGRETLASLRTVMVDGGYILARG